MLNKVILTGIVENVQKEERLVYFSVPSQGNVLHMEMRFSQEIVDHISNSFEQGQTLISVEGTVTTENGNLAITPLMIESYLVEKRETLLS